ncbi:FKBP-type peptidyl-prolyl cis-trans isomerase [Shewanella sp. GXUN23E]|uniref:FKBP-type peptidyl-prolyl cis-trans isomerase n=1 Tax=Shewanella sp. GXUN23E TaxID=3422498 RepID=UPI003D7CCBFB
MTVQDNMVVQFHYTLKDEQGDVLESNIGLEPVAYLHGHDNMMPGIEKALEGKAVGDKLSVTPDPVDTYGEVIENAVQRVPVKHLMGAKVWKPGMAAMVHTDQGQRQVTVVKVGKFMADIDINHPLAGRALTFDLEVTGIREATDEEIAHGHAHGVGGHHHG